MLLPPEFYSTLLRFAGQCTAAVIVLFSADYIAVPRSQEDDSHNVQAVIDSLALDYLQISLSHITGERLY